jgi:hypothetical protein
MKSELEMIWNEKPLAFPMHLAGWFQGFKLNNESKIFKTKGKKLNPVKKIRKIIYK